MELVEDIQLEAGDEGGHTFSVVEDLVLTMMGKLEFVLLDVERHWRS